MRGLPLVIALAGFTAVGAVRARVAERFHSQQTKTDVYTLPPPAALAVASLGHRSALADLIMTQVLVSYGIHAQEHRRLEFAGDYIDAINELDPKFRDPYRFSDTLLVFGPDEPTPENYRKARAVFERGLENFPYDTELWLTAGQYLLYLGGPHLPDPTERAEWKIAGAKMLSRACDLTSNNDRIAYQCIAAAGVLTTTGEREAAIASIQRLVSVNDDPEIQRLALGYLAAKLDERNKERQEHRRDVFRAAWKADFPFITKDMMLVVGPRTALARCAGRADDTALDCATSWKAWTTIADPAP